MKTRPGRVPPPVPAIVLGCYTSGLAVIRALAAGGVGVVAVHHDPTEFAHTSKYVRRSLRSPDPERSEESFVELLEGLARGVLVPTSDETLTVVARHRRRLEARHTVACMEPELVATFIDKKQTYEAAERVGVPVPRTFVPRSADDLARNAESVGYPCLVKPRESHTYFNRFGRKMVKVESFDELVRAWREASDAGLGVLIQEFVPGPDRSGTNYNAYLIDGRPVADCTAQKIALSPPEIGFPRIVVSRELPEVIASGRRLLEGMGVSGFANVEFKRDARDGVYKLMEVNARHNMSTLLSVRSGLDFPGIMYRHLVLGERPAPARSESGIYWINPIADLAQLVRTRTWSRARWRPYVHPHVFDVLDARDPKPFAKRAVDIARRLRTQTARGRRRAGAAAHRPR